MPLIKVVCPHCEKNVEFNVTSVTRSRECPLCGKPIILQFMTQEKRQKRKALLMPATDALEGASVKPEPVGVEPKVLEGDIRRRMLHDPEVLASMKQLKWGAVIVLGLIVLMMTANYFHLLETIEGAFTGATHHEQEDDVLPTARLNPAGSSAAPKKPEASGNDGSVQQGKSGPDKKSAPPPPQTGLSELELAMKATASFLGARTVDERLPFIRDRKLMEKAFREYYAKHGDGPTLFEKVDILAVNPEGKFTYSFSVVMPKGDKLRILVGKSLSGDYVVDWASFVLHGDMDWAEFKARKPTAPTLFRLLAIQEDFYNHKFVDAKSLLCMKLDDPREPEAAPIYGYVLRSSSLGRSMEFELRKSLGEAVPLILTLKYPMDSDTDNQVWVHELVSEGWVTRGR